MKKNKNKMIGMSTGFTLRSMKDLYCNNSIIKTGTMIAGVMLTSCTEKDNNNAKEDETNKTDKINLSALKDDVKNNLATQLGTDVNGLQTKIDELDLTPKDIDEEGKLTESGLQKTKAKEPVATDPNDKTIDLSKLKGGVKTKLAGHLGVKEEKLQDEINGLKLDKDDINETTGELKDSGLQKKKEAEDGKMAEALKFLGENKEKFITYLDDLDSYFGNQKGKFAVDIKDKDEEYIKQQVINLCITYAKHKSDNGEIQFSKICKELESSKFIKSKITEFIDGAIFTNVKYKCAQNGDNQITVTVKNDNKQVDFDLGITADELCSLKTTKNGKEVETKLYRITIEIDGDLPVDDLTKLLVPKTKEEIKDEAESQIKAILEASIKTGNTIVVDDFAKLATTLKQLVEATQKLLQGKYNDKFLADVKDLKALHTAFDSKKNYDDVIKTEFDAQLAAIKTALNNVNGGELNESIIMDTPALKLHDNDQKIESHTIHEVISALLTYNSNYTDNNSKSVIKDYIDGCTNAKIEVKNDGEANLELEFVNGEKVNKQGIVAFAEQNTAGGNQIININKAFETALKNKIGTLNFGIVNSQKTCKEQISNSYIDTVLNFDKVKNNVPADIERGLRTACGKDKIVITTVDDVKNHIVVPVMNKVFGDDNLVKAVFTKVKKLLELEVGGTNGHNKKTLVANGLASIGKDDDGSASVVANDINVNTNSFGTATRLKTALLDIRKAILDYNDSVKSDPNVVKDFFKVYFGEVGTGKITVMTGGADVPNDLEWMRLGKAVAKWVFSKSENDGYNDEQQMRKNYDAASKALAMSILLNNVKVEDYAAPANKNYTNLLWFTPGNNDHNLDIMNNNGVDGLGGSNLTGSTNVLNATKVQVDFDNMIICNQLKTKTSAANQGNPESIVVPALTGNTWKGAQIVEKNFNNNFDNANGNAIKSDFALLALFLGYFNKNGEMIDIKVKAKQHNAQEIYVAKIDIS